MTRIERQSKRRRQKIRRICAGCAALLMIFAIAGVALLPAGADAEPEKEPPKTQAPSRSPAPSPVPLAQQVREDSPAECLAKMLYGEARGCSTTEQAAVIWCALNRVDSEDPYFPDNIVGVVTQPYQFAGYDASNPLDPAILALVEDVLARWSIEDICTGDVGRVLPETYLFFTGNGKNNTFTTGWKGGEVWDWELASPYEEANP